MSFLRCALVFVILAIHLVALGAEFDPEVSYEKGDVFWISPEKAHPTQYWKGDLETEFLLRDEGEKFETFSKKELKTYLKEEAGTAVIGPKSATNPTPTVYIIDGHHHNFTYATLGVPRMYFEVDKDWRHLSYTEFKKRMLNRDGARKNTRAYLRGLKGELLPFEKIPKSTLGLKNDPYRGIVFPLVALGILEKDGDKFPNYGEFHIADFLRHKIAVKSPSGKNRLFYATREAGFLLTGNEAQEAELPGQYRMKRKRCARLLEGLGEYF